MRDLEAIEVQEVSGADFQCHGECTVQVTCVFDVCVPYVSCNVTCSF